MELAPALTSQLNHVYRSKLAVSNLFIRTQKKFCILPLDLIRKFSVCFGDLFGNFITHTDYTPLRMPSWVNEFSTALQYLQSLQYANSALHYLWTLTLCLLDSLLSNTFSVSLYTILKLFSSLLLTISFYTLTLNIHFLISSDSSSQTFKAHNDTMVKTNRSFENGEKLL